MDYRQRVRQEAQLAGLDPNIAEAVLMRESAGNPNAVSPVGAQGLMQLMPGTARELGVNPADPVQNIQGGVKYLKKQIDQYGVPAGIAAYNAGPGRVAQAGGNFNALPAETRAYVPAVMNTAANLAQGGGRVNQEPNIGQIMSALDKAKAANDTDAVNEINGLLTSKFSAAKQKAQAAGDTAAVAEIEAQMNNFAGKPQTVPPVGKVESAPLPETSLTDKLIRQAGLTGRYALEGGEQAVTYPIRAVGSAIAGGLNLAGKKDWADYVQKSLGTGGNGGKVLADQLGLPNPETGLEKAVAGGSKALAGAGVGSILGKAAEGGKEVVKQAANVLMPGAKTAGEAATFGALGAGMEAAPVETATGLAAAAALKGGAKSYAAKSVEKKLMAAADGNPNLAAIDAEIIQDIGTKAANSNLRGKELKTYLLNNIDKAYIDQAKNSIQASNPAFLKKLDVKDVLAEAPTITTDKLMKIRGTPEGDALADAIVKQQRARSLTGQTHASDSLGALAARTAITSTPTAIGGAVGGPVGALVGALGTKWAEKVGQMATGKSSRATEAATLTKDRYQTAAQNILNKNGASEASQSYGTVYQMAKQAERNSEAQQIAREANAAKYKAEGQAANTDATKLIRDGWSKGRTAAGGIHQAITDYTGLKNQELVDAVEEFAKRRPEMSKYAEAIRDNNPVRNVKLLGAIQDELADIAVQQGSNSVVRKQLGSMFGKKVADNIPDDILTTAKNAINSADDTTLSQVIRGRTANASGETLFNPPGYGVGVLSQILKDKKAGKELGEEAQGILKLFNLE